MQFDLFPPKYKDQSLGEIHYERDRITKDEEKRHNERCRYISSQLSANTAPNLVWKIALPIIGAVVGMFQCAIIPDFLSIFWELLQSPGPSLGASFLCFLVPILVGLLLGLFIDARSMKKFEKERDENAARLALEQIREDQLYRQNVERINREYCEKEQKLNDYESAFQNAAKQLCPVFDRSEIAGLLAATLADFFLESIKKEKREKSIEKISVRLTVSVYPGYVQYHCIDSETGWTIRKDFSFAQQRVRDLTGPLEQTALARVVAVRTKSNIKTKLPTDPSGTDYDISIKPTFFHDYVSAELLYTANNGNFVPSRNW